MKRLPSVRSLLYVAGLVVVAYLIAGVYLAGKNEIPAPQGDGGPVVFDAGHAQGRRIDARSWSVDYDKLVANSDQTILNLDGIHNGVIYKKGKPYLHVQASHMTVNTVTRDFTVSGQLHVESASDEPQRSFDTTLAMWNDGSQTLTLPAKTTIESGAGAPLSIDAMTFNVRTGKLELHKVSGAVRI